MPEHVSFRTKPRLAQGMLVRALESRVPFAWVTGDEVYGRDRSLRLWPEQEGIPHVMAIKSNEKLWAGTDKGPRQVRADRLALQVEESGWIRCSGGGRGQGTQDVRLDRRVDTGPERGGQGSLVAVPPQHR